MILEASGDAEWVSRMGQTAIHVQAFNGNGESLSKLMSVVGADFLERPDLAGRTALHCADYHTLTSEDPSVVASMLHKGANPLATTRTGVLSCSAGTIQKALVYAEVRSKKRLYIYMRRWGLDIWSLTKCFIIICATRNFEQIVVQNTVPREDTAEHSNYSSS